MIAAAHLRVTTAGVDVRVEGRPLRVTGRNDWWGYGDVDRGQVLLLRDPVGLLIRPSDFPERQARDLNTAGGWRYFGNHELIEVVSEWRR